MSALPAPEGALLSVPELMPVLDGHDTYRVVPIRVDAITIPGDYPRHMPTGFPGDLDEATRALRDSMASGMGQGSPIVVSPPDASGQFVLRDGLRRLMVAKELLGWSFVNALVTDALSADLPRLKYFLDVNTCRIGLTPSQAVAVQRELEAILEPIYATRRAHAKQTAAAEESADRTVTLVPLPSGSKRREVTAAATGYSPTTLRRARVVMEAATDPSLTPDQRAQVAEQITLMDSTGRVDPALKAIKAIKSDNQPRPTPPASVREKETARAALARARATAETVRATVVAVQDALFETETDIDGEAALTELEAALSEGLATVRAQLAKIRSRA